MIRLLPVACFVAALAQASSTDRGLLDRGYSDMYNLRFDDAHKAFSSYRTMRPEDPLGPVSDAAAYLFSEFDRLQVWQSEFFESDKAYLSAKKRQPDAATKARFEEDLQQTRKLADLQIKEQPGQCANAAFAEVLASGLRADYLALIERRDLAALKQIESARKIADELLSKHPTCYDAYIAVGIENYILGRKPGLVRWFLRVGGAQTDKQRGLDQLRLTAEHGHYLLPYARLLLAMAAVRDGDKAKARNLLSWLAEHYPQNNLYCVELKRLNGFHAK